MAQQNGAIGCLIYDDPEQAAPKIASQKIYPNGEFLPSGGTQRGTVYGILQNIIHMYTILLFL